MKINKIISLAIMLTLSSCAKYKDTPVRVAVPIQRINISESEVRCLALNALYEARSEEDEYILAQMKSVVNRARIEKLSYCDTVNHYGYNSRGKKVFWYSWHTDLTKKQKKDVFLRNKKLYFKIKDLAYDYVAGGLDTKKISKNHDHYIPVDFAFSGNAPSWFKHSCEYKTILGGHIFCVGVR